jgi:hypothetical protein
MPVTNNSAPSYIHAGQARVRARGVPPAVPRRQLGQLRRGTARTRSAPFLFFISNILLLCAGLYGGLYARPCNKILSPATLSSAGAAERLRRWQVTYLVPHSTGVENVGLNNRRRGSEELQLVMSVLRAALQLAPRHPRALYAAAAALEAAGEVALG